VASYNTAGGDGVTTWLVEVAEERIVGNITWTVSGSKSSYNTAREDARRCNVITWLMEVADGRIAASML